MILPDNYKQYKYVALFLKNERSIDAYGNEHDGYYLAVCNNRKRLLKTVENVCWGSFNKGFIWTTQDFTEYDVPSWVIYRKCDEKKNIMLNKLMLIPYDEVDCFEDTDPNAVNRFRDECAREHDKNALYMREY